VNFDVIYQLLIRYSVCQIQEEKKWEYNRRVCQFERVPGTSCIGGWVGPRASLDTVVMRKSPCRTGTPDHPAQRYTAEISRILLLDRNK
jgi:hypothetical protein